MASSSVPTELGTKKISSVLREYAVPAIIAMTASSLYNMVDSIYLGHIEGTGHLAITAVAVCFPLMNLSAALGTLVGIGAATLISVLLGQKNYSLAGKALENDVTLNTFFGIVFSATALVWLSPILRFFGASDLTLPYARAYMYPLLIGNVVTHLYFGLNAVIRASGNPKLAMGLTLFTVISNSILDPIFIFVLDMGIQGAALATILCQTMAMIYSMWYFMDKNKFMHLPSKIFGIHWKLARKSLAIGMGPFLMNAASCIVALFINQQLGRYGGDMHIGGYGIANRLTFLFVMIVMGLNQGMQPIAGYNFGARQYSRVKETFFLTAKWATLIMCLSFIVSEVFPEIAASAFTDDPLLKDIAAKGLRIMNVVIPIIGFQMVSTNLFQSLGMVDKSVILSLSRQLLFLVPCVYILPLFMGQDGVWMSFPVSDALASILTIIFMGRLIKKLSRLKDGDDPSVLGSRIRESAKKVQQ